jgi:hypothetical protein
MLSSHPFNFARIATSVLWALVLFSKRAEAPSRVLRYVNCLAGGVLTPPTADLAVG